MDVHKKEALIAARNARAYASEEIEDTGPELAMEMEDFLKLADHGVEGQGLDGDAEGDEDDDAEEDERAPPVYANRDDGDFPQGGRVDPYTIDTYNDRQKGRGKKNKDGGLKTGDWTPGYPTSPGGGYGNVQAQGQLFPNSNMGPYGGGSNMGSNIGPYNSATQDELTTEYYKRAQCVIIAIAVVIIFGGVYHMAHQHNLKLRQELARSKLHPPAPPLGPPSAPSPALPPAGSEPDQCLLYPETPGCPPAAAQSGVAPPGPPGPPGQPALPPPPPPPPCDDSDDNCASWAGADPKAETSQCVTNPTFMLVSCKKACGECIPLGAGPAPPPPPPQLAS